MPSFRERYPAPQASERWVETAELRRTIKDKVGELTREVGTSNLKIIDLDILKQIVGRVEQYCNLNTGDTLPVIDLSNHLTFTELVDRVEKVDEAAASLLEQAILGSENVISFQRRRHRASGKEALGKIAEDDIDAAFEEIIQTGN